MSDFALFVVAPYVAAAILLAGTLGALGDRPPRGRRDAADLTASSLIRDHRVLAIGLLGVAAGHALIVAWPAAIVSWTRTFVGLLVLEISLFLLGLTALAGLVMVIARHVRRLPRHSIGTIDLVFAGVLLVAVISGLGIAALHRWAAAWSSVTLVPYVRSVADLQPDLRHLEAMPYLVKLHLFSTSALIAMVPFTMPMRVFLSAARHAADRALAPVSVALARKRQQWQDWARQSGGNLIWSEEDD